MGTESFPRAVANLITEDPDVIKDKPNWPYEFEYDEDEYTDPDLLGDYMFYVKYLVGAEYTPGEPMVRYYPDGSGYPGSGPSWEWEVTDVVEVEAYDKDGDKVENFELTDEWKERFIQSLNGQLDDEKMHEQMSSDLDAKNEPDDEAYDRYRDEGR